MSLVNCTLNYQNSGSFEYGAKQRRGKTHLGQGEKADQMLFWLAIETGARR